MPNHVSILGSGVATMDIYVNQGRMYPGGNEYNVVCNAGLLGARAGFFGVFGNDLAGTLLEETLVKCGVEISHCRHETGSSGYSLVTFTEDSDRVFLDWNRQGVTDLHPTPFSTEELRYAKEFDVLCAGRLSHVTPEQLLLLKNNGIDVCYDFHAAFTEADIHSIAPYVRYAFFSCSHLPVEETQRCLLEAVNCGCSLAIGTRGSDSIHAYDGIQFYEQAVIPVAATDTLGAGDSFIAAFLVHYLRSCKAGDITPEGCIRQALKAAAEHAAKVVCIEGSVGIGYDADPNCLSDIINFA